MKRAKGKTGAGTSKPLCDCNECACKKCPDVVKLLSISTTDSRPSRQIAKGKSKKGKKKAKIGKPDPPSILGILQDRDDCNCEVVSKAVQSNIPANLGLYEKRWEHINKKHDDFDNKNGETSHEAHSNDDPK